MARRKRTTASPIRDADDLIDEATKRLAAIERALEALQRRRRRWSTLALSAQKELREQIASGRRLGPLKHPPAS